MEKQIKCPIDGHLCERVECRLDSEWPECREAVVRQADNVLLLMEINPDLGLDIKAEEDRNNELIKLRANQLGVNLDMFREKIDIEIQNRIDK
jgi:hypothetical protein